MLDFTLVMGASVVVIARLLIVLLTHLPAMLDSISLAVAVEL